MTKSQENSEVPENWGLAKMVESLERLGYGDDQFTKALRAGLEGKSPDGLQLAKNQRLLIAVLKGRRNSP